MWSLSSVIALLWLAQVASSNLDLEFIHEPNSQLVKISDPRAVFRCTASPSTAEIRWLYKGQPIPHSIRWIRASHHKLTVHLNRMDKSLKSHHFVENSYFQCEARLKGQVLVSTPAKLIIAALDQFPPQPDIEIAAFVGNTAVIPCDPPKSEPAVVTEFIFNGTTISESTDRYKIMPSGDLQILNVTYGDTGEYKCVANNPFLMKKVTSKRKVLLYIEEPSKPKPLSFVKSPSPKTAVALGSNVTLECVVSGYPPPKITWRKHDGKLPESRHRVVGGNLFITSIRRGEEGTFYCEAENSLGSKISEGAVIEVQETPQIVRSPKSLTVDVGDNVSLLCVTRGHPKPTITWIHNGRVFPNVSLSKKSPLVIENIGRRHAGIYQCFASNDLATVYSTAFISVIKGNKSHHDDYDDYDDSLFKPHKSHHDKNYDYDVFDHDRDHGISAKRPHKRKHKGVKLIPPSKPYVTRLSNSSVMVRWNVPRNDGLPILFFKVQYKEVGRKNSQWVTTDDEIAAHIHSYAVTNLKTGAAYRFQIAAVYSNNDNKSGPVSSKFILLKDPPMEKPPSAPLLIFAEAESPSAITLHWEYSNPDAIPIEGFFIHYRATHTAGKYLKVTVLGANTRSHIISHLLSDTGYDIKMQCFNDAGTSDFSNIFTSKTKPAEVPPGSKKHMKSRFSEDGDISLTETVSSKYSESNTTLYIILGTVAGLLLIAVFCCTVLFFRQKNNPESTCDNDNDLEEQIALSNGYVTSNGYIPSQNKINISINPLSHLEEDGDKPNELENIVSNNNEIIRLQTFNIHVDHPANSLLNEHEIHESELNGSNQIDTVIVPYDSDLGVESTQDN